MSGTVAFFGKTKTSGEATMYPKPVDDLQGWRVRAMGAGNTSIVIAAEQSVISWGVPATPSPPLPLSPPARPPRALRYVQRAG